MKKVIISTSFTHSIFNFRLNIIKELIDRGYIVHVLAPNISAEDKQKLENLNVVSWSVNVDGRSMSVFALARYFCQLLTLVFRIQPDFFISYSMKPNFVGSLVCKLFNKRNISLITGLGKLYIGKPPQSFLRRKIHSIMQGVVGASIGLSNLIVFQNEADIDFFTKRGWIKSSSKSYLMPGSGVDTHRFFFREITEFHRVLLIGRLIEAKGIREFCRAVALFDNAKFQFQILGWEEYGNDAIHPDEIAQLSNGKVSYLGSAEDVVPLIHQSTFLILPAYREGLARSLLEGMACGRPILMSDAPGLSDLHDSKYSIKFEPKNVNDLLRALNEMNELSQPTVTRMGRAAANSIVGKYDQHSVAVGFVDQMERL